MQQAWQHLNGVRCNRFELPEEVISYRQTPGFTERSLSAGLKQDHPTKAGVWAKIVVTEGMLRYRIDLLDVDMKLCTDRFGIVLPEVHHQVVFLATAPFFLAFCRSLN